MLNKWIKSVFISSLLWLESCEFTMWNSFHFLNTHSHTFPYARTWVWNAKSSFRYMQRSVTDSQLRKRQTWQRQRQTITLYKCERATCHQQHFRLTFLESHTNSFALTQRTCALYVFAVRFWLAYDTTSQFYDDNLLWWKHYITSSNVINRNSCHQFVCTESGRMRVPTSRQQWLCYRAREKLPRKSWHAICSQRRRFHETFHLSFVIWWCLLMAMALLCAM